MSDYKEKLQNIKQIYTLAKDRRSISNTEKALNQAIFKSELLDHDLIKKIVRSAEEDIIAIDLLLANDTTLNEKDKELDRKLLFAEKGWIIEHIIRRFSQVENNKIIDTIERSIDAIEKRSKQYQVLN